jgi:hypothetical protein
VGLIYLNVAAQAPTRLASLATLPLRGRD